MSVKGKGKRAKATALCMVLVLFFFGIAAHLQAQQTILEVIDLKYRNAEQIVPMLKPLLAPGGVNRARGHCGSHDSHVVTT